ncbi:nuclear pore complex protein Nup153-like [Hipposideros larvatus]
MTRKSVSIAGNRTAYFQPSLTALGELRKTNQRIDRKLSTENETNTTIGQKREQEESGVCHTNFSMSAASGLPCGEGGGGGNMNHKRMGFVATQHPEEKFGLTVNVPVAKTAELSGSSSVSEPVTSGSDIGVSKNTAVPPLWPVETDHYHTLSQHTATSSKKPAFNMCRVSRIPQLIGKPSILKTRDFGDSPFYPGKTRYGGAAAVVRQPKVRNTPYQVPVRRQMKTKQLNTQSCGVMSLTAQRILRSLEMSTPLLTLDKSGMDIAMYFQAQRQKTGNDTNTTIGQKREQEESVCHTNFSVCATNGLPCGEGSGGDEMKHDRMGFVATKHPEEEIGFAVSAPVAKTAELSESSSVSEPVTSGSDTDASKDTSVLPLWFAETDRYRTLSQDTATSSKKPAFNVSVFGRISLTACEKDMIRAPNTGEESITRANGLSCGGSNESKKMTQETTGHVATKRTEEEVGVILSVPIAKTAELSGSSSSSEPITSRSSFTSLKPDTVAAQPTTTGPGVCARPAISSFSSSGMGLSENLKTRLSWQCDPYLHMNKVTDNKSITCHSTKLPPSDSAKQNGMGTPSKSGRSTLCASETDFQDKLKPAVGTCDCDTWLVQNQWEATKCVACETPKPEPGVKRVLTLPVASESAVTATASSSGCTVTTGALRFRRKSKRPVGSWQCPLCCDYNNAEDKKCVTCICEKPVPASKFSSSSSVPVSLSSGGRLVLKKFEKPEGSWDCEVCLVQNKADATKCVACESAKPGTNSALKGIGTSSSSSNPAAPSFKSDISSTSSGPSQTLTSFESVQFGGPGGLKGDVSSDSGSLKSMSEGFKFSKPTAVFKLGLSSDSKPEQVKKDSKNDNNFKFGLPSDLSHPASLAPSQCGANVYHLGQQGKKETGPQASSVGFSLGTGVINPTPAATSTIVTSADKNSFSFETVETKGTSVAPFPCKESEAKKDKRPAAKGQVTFGNMDPAPMPSASSFVWGAKSENQPEAVPSASLLFEKTTDKEEPKSQSMSERKDQSSSNPVFSSLNKSSSNTSPPATSATGSITDSSTCLSRAPVAASVYGQGSTVSTSAFGISPTSTSCQSLVFSKDSKRATTPNEGPAVTPGVSGPGARSSNTAQSDFISGATTTPRAADFSFVVDTGPSVPSTSRKFVLNRTPIFGQSQGASWPNPPGFRSRSSSDALFSAGSQPSSPTLGTVSSSCQPPVFGQQPGHSAPASKFSSSSVPVSLSSGGRLVLKKFKKPEGSWDCEVCLVQNKADATKCVACESAKPGTNSALKGIGTSSSSSNPAAPSFKSDISSTSSGPSQTLTSFESVQFGGPGGLKGDVSSDSGSLKSMSEGFKFSKPTAVFKLGLSSDSKPEQVKKDSKNDNNFKFGLPSDLSHPASLAPSQCGANVYHLGQQGKKETGPQASSVGFSLGTGVINPTPAATSTIVTSADKNSFSFETVETKGTSVAPFPCKESEAKKDKRPAAKGQVTFGNMDPAPMPSASSFVWGAKSENQPEAVPSASLLFEKTTDKEEPKSQPMSERKDQSSSNPVFSSLNKSSSNTSPPATSATGSITDSSTCLSRAPVAASVYGQGSTVSTSAFGISPTSTSCQSLVFSKDSKRATTPNKVPAVTPGVSSPGARSSNTAQSDFISGATTTPRAADFSFVVDTGPSVPSTSRKFVLNRTPIFGQSQGASWPNPPGFRSRSSSDALFSAGSQPSSPTLGTVSSSCQPPVFGQQPGHSAPASKFSSSSVPVSLSSGGRLVLKKFKKPEGSWDCEVCLVQNKADATKCVACESAKPGTNSALKGIGTSSSSSNPAAPSFKSDISSTSSGPSQTLTSFESVQFGGPGGLKGDVSSDSGSLKSMSEGFKFSKPTAVFKLGLSSDSKPEQVKKDSKNDNNFKFGLPSDLSHPASLAPSQCGANVYHLGQQGKKETGPQASSVGFSLGTGVINPTPAATSTIVTSADKNSFSFETVETKGTSVAPFPCKESEAKKDKRPAAKGQVTFGNMDPAPMPSASSFVWGAKSENQPEAVPSASLLFGKTTDKEEPKSQPMSERKGEQDLDASMKGSQHFIRRPRDLCPRSF